MNLKLRTLAGEALGASLDDLAALRIEVFRAFPYLYDGSRGYERAYLAGYADMPGAILVGAFDGSRLVGAATGMPVELCDAAITGPLDRAGHGLGETFYCAESVLLPQYRGRGIGHCFFDVREGHARALGRKYSTFCAVMRPADHPARPNGYRPLDAFWRRRGYTPLSGVAATIGWRDVGEAAETRKSLQFWIRPL